MRGHGSGASGARRTWKRTSVEDAQDEAKLAGLEALRGAELVLKGDLGVGVHNRVEGGHGVLATGGKRREREHELRSTLEEPALTATWHRSSRRAVCTHVLVDLVGVRGVVDGAVNTLEKERRLATVVDADKSRHN